MNADSATDAAALGRVRWDDLVVVANRLPVERVPEVGSVRWRRSPGGLVAALEPILRRREGLWIGWRGAPGEAGRGSGQPPQLAQ